MRTLSPDLPNQRPRKVFFFFYTVLLLEMRPSLKAPQRSPRMRLDRHADAERRRHAPMPNKSHRVAGKKKHIFPQTLAISVLMTDTRTS